MTTTTLQSIDNKTQDDTSQFLTFQLGGEEYGLDILSVQEIRGYVQPTRLPNSPPHVTGVLNLRGSIVPLYDLRRMFDLEQIEYDQFAAIVVATIDSSVVGLVVDRVSEVITAATSDIQPAPSVSNTSTQDCVRGILRHEEQLIILLDARALLGGSEIDVALAA